MKKRLEISRLDRSISQDGVIHQRGSQGVVVWRCGVGGGRGGVSQCANDNPQQRIRRKKGGYRDNSLVKGQPS